MVQTPIDLDALARAEVIREPFPYAIVPHFVRAGALAAIERDYPEIADHGSYPLAILDYGPAFADLVRALEDAPFRALVEAKLGMDLSGKPVMTTARGYCAAKDGRIHADSGTKLVTVLIYMNGKWDYPKGRLRLLSSPADLDAVIAEVPPDEGTLLLFRNQPNAWHGFESFEGPRRVIQVNWVTKASVVWREQIRHRISAIFKRSGKRRGRAGARSRV